MRATTSLPAVPRQPLTRKHFPTHVSAGVFYLFYITFSLMLALSCGLVTCPIHLLPQAAHIASTTSCSCSLVIGSALRVVVHARVVLSCYRYCYLIVLSVGES
jgi:hypothetical protein